MAVSGLRRELSAAGVDTHNLSAEQERMATVVATVSQRVNQSQRIVRAEQLLAIRSQKDLQREINLVSAAYARLAQSGTVSTQELERAASAAKARIAELRAEAKGAGSPGSTVLPSAAQQLVPSLGAAYITQQSVRQYLDFGTAMAKVSTQLDGQLEPVQMLTKNVREMAGKWGSMPPSPPMR
ncbi:hypothetical protein [Paludibacterium denitrificans]|uniref:Uncharacterized protein n=1 Tax=Paludibacterium denitrificans TaxID=2675226 RepID=A0A844GB40_9NEIS|nr:hypothetical protein [Paludibacterium denitrificans]MTD32511.1 hypothetical protein [Paludibacterium denitrificans]